MKKLMIAALMIFASSAVFAGDSDALKAIMKATGAKMDKKDKDNDKKKEGED